MWNAITDVPGVLVGQVSDAETTRQLRQGVQPRSLAGTNTTPGVVATNARLTRPQARKPARLAQHGLV
ncbi:MAG TPA: hypothetical protein VIH59_10625 [Candidatus Tectomicrobia bacterium]